MPLELRTKSDLRAAFKDANIWARRDLGQNFLVDHNLLDFLVRSADVGPDDLVLDIGAGTGLLTRHLAERAWRVWAVEIDRRLCNFFKHYTEGLSNVVLLNQDILKDKFTMAPNIRDGLLAELESRPGAQLKVVANLPYSVSTLVIPNMLESRLPVQTIVLTVQKEVGERLTASPGTREYGSLSIIVQAWAKVEILRRLSNTVFWPRPKVDSAIVRVTPVDTRTREMNDPLWFGKVARGLFSARRKKAINALKNVKDLGLSSDELYVGFREAGIDPEQRGELLDVDQVVALSNTLLDISRAKSSSKTSSG